MKFIKIFLPRKRSRMTKKVLGFLAIFALSGLFFQTSVGTAEVHAQTVQTNDATPQTGISSMGLVDILDLILKVVYILLWPLLVVAGWAMDNTLVYGSMFGLDVPLWKFRNILKNFANFTLGFLVLFAILKSIFTNSGMGSLKDGKTPLGIIKKTLIAGILIQASWFLIAATIDVSTVATYAVGGLPLNVLKTTPLGQKKILAVDAKIDFNKIQNLNDKGDILSLTYAAGPHKLSACKISNDMCSATGDNRYIIGRKQMSGTEMGKCVFGGNMVIFYDETGLQNESLFQAPNPSYESFVNGSNQYCVDQSMRDAWVNSGFVIDIYSGASFSGAKATGQKRFDGTPAMMLSELVDRSKGFVGPMVTIYSSLLNFAEISDSGNDSFGKVSGEMIIRAAFAVMLFFPLLALAVVLIVRVGFLWLVIAAAPFIVLLETFKEALKLPADFKLGEHLKLPNIISVIFAPVITVFALSLAVIFITTLINTLTPNGAHNNTIDAILAPQIVKQPTTDGSQKYLVGGSQMTLSNFNRGGNLDRFSWIIVNLVAVGLMRALVFAAIKSNSIGKKFGGGIEKRGGNFMSTLPIISVPGQDKKVGFGSIANVVSDTPDRYISHIKGEQEEIGRKFADAKFGIDNYDDKKTKITQEQHTAIASALKSNTNINAQIEKINAGRNEDDTQLTAGEYITNSANLKALNDIIKSMSGKESALSNAAKLWGEEFQKKIDAGTYTTAEQMETELNTNEITKRYAKSQKSITSKDEKGATKTYTITYDDTKNEATVKDETAPADKTTEKPK